MIEIQLTKGYVAIVDDADADLAGIKWNVLPAGYTFYAKRQGYDCERNVYITVLLHRVIVERSLSRKLIKGEVIDHINRNGLDNRRENLRSCNQHQNAMNSRTPKNSILGVKGVTYIKGRKSPYRGQITVGGKLLYLGHYTTAEAAHEAYCKAAEFYFGEFWRAA